MVRKAAAQLSVSQRITKILRSPAAWIFFMSILLSLYAGKYVTPTWSLERLNLEVNMNTSGDLYYVYREKQKVITATSPEYITLTKANIEQWNKEGKNPPITEEFSYETVSVNGQQTRSYYQLSAKRHFGHWSLLPAAVAIILCWLIREPITALLGGIISGAFLLGYYDITEAVFIPKLMTKGAAGILILYLWLLGGLMGIWSRTGAAHAFAEFMTKHVVRGPKTAKLVAWMLGVIFFQGGTVSTVLVGTTVKPLADEERISHEELSYIVDSTASPIAAILPFNAWPGYVQAFLYVSGVSFLATEADRLKFFFQAIPLSFYCIFAVIGTFLLSIDKSPILGKRLKTAIKRARKTGELDHPDSEPLSSKELEVSHVPEGYKPNVLEFFIPLFTLIGIAIGTYITMGSPQVRWAFGGALVVAISMALFRGMRLRDVIEGIDMGLKGVVLGSFILILAITIGSLSKEAGGGIYMVELLGGKIPYWILPVILQLLTIVISFSTGTSWGTYAVAFPLAMPLAWAVGSAAGLDNLHLYMMICFATVMNGSIFGDQCSPISDTTVLSSICTGADLMDHVKSQIVPATAAASLAAICWTGMALLFC